MSPPLVSCIVPVFNGETYLAEALDCILAQTYRPIEIIVADDGSTDGSAAIVARYGDRVRYVSQPHTNAPSARNLGLQAARGELIAFLDHDDLWHHEKLERQVARFAARPELEVSVTHIQAIWIAELQDEAERFRDHPLAQPQPGYVTVTMLARRALFDRVGGFNTTLNVGDPMEWFVRAAEHGAVMELLPDTLAYRRMQKRSTLSWDAGGSNRRMTGAMQAALLRVVKESLDRRRAGGGPVRAYHFPDAAPPTPASVSTVGEGTNQRAASAPRGLVSDHVAGAEDAPLISCVVPAYNSARYVREALDSILAQTYRPIEIIVADDGSTDATAEIVASYGDAVRYVCHACAGPPATRNLGLRHARGAFVAFLDADDRWHAEKLARQMARFRARPEIGVSVTQIQNVWIPELAHEEHEYRDDPRAGVLPGYVTMTMLARRTAFDAVGPFDESLRHSDAADWFLRAAARGIVIEMLPEVLTDHRMHHSNLSRREHAASRREFLLLVKRSLDARRVRGQEAAPIAAFDDPEDAA